MTATESTTCDGNCAACPSAAPSATGTQQPSPQARMPGPYQGAGLVWRAIGFFLGPIVTAIIGSVMAGPSSLHSWLGGLTGLFIGVFLAAVWGRRSTAEAHGETGAHHV